MTTDARGMVLEPGMTLESMAIPGRIALYIGADANCVLLKPHGWAPVDVHVDDAHADGLIRVKHRVWERVGFWQLADITGRVCHFDSDGVGAVVRAKATRATPSVAGNGPSDEAARVVEVGR